MYARRFLVVVGALASLVACGETPYAPVTVFDAGMPPSVDVGFFGQDADTDAGPEADAAGGADAAGVDGAALDAGGGDASDGDGAVLDGGARPDAGPGPDGAVIDGGGLDAAAPDADLADGALPDASPVDAGPPDTGVDGGVLALTPAMAELPLGGQVLFEVTAAPGTTPIWSVDGVPGGDATVGTVVPEADPRQATYTAPLDAPALPASHAVEVSLGTGVGTAPVSLVYPQPTLTAINPRRVPASTQTVQVALTGTGFTTGTRVLVDGVLATATLGGWTSLTVTLPSFAASTAGTWDVTVSNPAPGGGQASLPIEVVFTDVTVDPTLPTGIEALFDAATVSTLAGRQPAITYPEHQAVAPRNFPAPQVSWVHPGSNVCRVRMTSATVQVDDYVSVPNGATPQENTSITHSATLWNNVTNTVFGLHATTLTVACGSLVNVGGTPALANGEIFESAPLTYNISFDALGGRIVYFSGLIEGLWRIDLGQSVATGQPFAGPSPSFALNTTPQCLGCHSFSASGQRMGYIADAVEWNVGVMDVMNGVPSLAVPAASGVVGDWTSMHPTEDVLLSIDLTGRITLVNANNGQLITVVPTQAAGAFVTHPVWAPSGNQIAFVSGAAGVNGVADAAQGQIWTMPVTRVGTTYTFGTPTLLASPAVAGGSAYYPSYSPDGQWILFSQAPSGSSYDNLQAKVWLVKADGTVGPVELARANQPGANLSNSWPRWAPQVSGSRYWIVFNSQRPYGPYNGTGPQQLWVATIDTSLLPQDPSAPAVWLPGQEPFTGNLTAEWTVAF